MSRHRAERVPRLPHLTAIGDDYLDALEIEVKGSSPVEDTYRRRIADARLDGDSRLVKDLERALQTHLKNRLRSVAT